MRWHGRAKISALGRYRQEDERLRGIPGTTELTASPGAGGGGGWWKGLTIKQGSVVLSIAVPS